MRYLLKRLLLLLVAAWAALTLNFILPRLMPGNPVEAMLARYQGRLSPQAVNALEVQFGLNTHESAISQYFTYFGHTVTGNLGTSISEFPTKVSSIIGSSLPWTIGLVGFSVIVSFVIGTALGALAGWRRGSRFDSVAVPFGVMLSAMPVFWISLLALYFLAFKLGWFPLAGGIGGTGSVGISGAGSIISHAALPAITLTLVSVGGWVLLMRNSTVSVLGEDYIKFGRAKGLPERAVAFNYAVRNAILPQFTSFALALGFVVAGAIFTEYVFSYPGIAYNLYEAVLSLDYPLMQGIFLVIVVAVLLANFLADLLYVFLDPRIRLEARA
ncbi:MAG TPA: ABC transporter permease [Acidimicrobiales bacterium]|nr:ABC transporter permease [Acidimicrobiales bacterium]